MTSTLRLAGLTRFGQVNLTEDDVRLVDVGFWTDIWQRAHLQAVLLNCGGIMAYHPTRLPGHPVATGVDERDLFGELVGAARGLGIEVVGRLDVGVVDQRFRDLHPEWMMVDAEGRSRTLNDVTGGNWGQPGGHRLENEMYYTCINSGLFTEYLPALLSEVAESYDIAGFFTNGFPTVALATPSTRMVCHCARCRELWASFSGHDEFPTADDPASPVFREYVRFLQAASLERLRELRAHTRSLAPGLSFTTSAIPSLSGGLPWTEWVAELDLLACDNQDRSSDYGRSAPSHSLWEVGLSSEVLRSVSAGRPALRVQSTARLRGGGRHSSKEPAELRLQMAEALAHGELPVWHAVSGKQYSRRWIDGVVEFDAWLAGAADAVTGRRSLADVGVVWSQASTWVQDWGVALPGPAFAHAVSGWHLALSRRRLPAQLILADGTESFEQVATLVLPSALVLDAGAVERITAFAAAGGGLIVCGTAGMTDQWGVPHDGDPIAALVGVDRRPPAADGYDLVSYLHVGTDPLVKRLLPELEEDELVVGGNWLVPFTTAARTGLVWNRSEHMIPTHAAGLPPASTQPTLALSEPKGRRVFLATDLDARYFVHRAGDHRDVLAGIAEWTLDPSGPSVVVRGDGRVDVRSWYTPTGIAIAVVNLDNPGANDEPVESFRPTGPLSVRVPGVDRARVGLRRQGADVEVVPGGDGVTFTIDTVVDFELATIETVSSGEDA
ncbi:Beta-galactosidase trimerisation domain-containing protein [Micromonospora pallida]|uniref:Beta-galactosidase trimerisation domain-containing protein n=1 Tax=Micromonospora pallida TaxID=145854 RepID=A0A1C6SIK3_9ACTN|nr:alpha-amylase family protein [Micromonospora pallida]SCL29227.1 Beta-galactosidase trimerisation domain-containing protein [Micromonospora pallida]